MTKIEQILAALTTALQATPAIAGGRVYRAMLAKIAEADTTAIVLVPGNAALQSTIVMGRVAWQLSVSVECYARGDAPDTAADALIEAVNTRLTADRTLGGLTDDITPHSVNWNYEMRDTDLAVVAIGFNVEYSNMEVAL